MSATRLRKLFVLAFPPERCLLAGWLSVFPPSGLEPGFPPGPHRPLPGAAALREGALLYEVAGEPVAAAEAMGRRGAA
jgi:hypothetical protein